MLSETLTIVNAARRRRKRYPYVSPSATFVAGETKMDINFIKSKIPSSEITMYNVKPSYRLAMNP